MPLFFFLLGIPLLLAVVAFLLKPSKMVGYVHALGYAGILVIACISAGDVVLGKHTISLFQFFYVDALSVFFMMTLSVVMFAASVYSIGYIAQDLKEGVISFKKAQVYYVLFNLFSFSMFFVTVVNNLGILWVAVEMTTLISAFLVGFYNTRQSVEAAWKYIIICSVGIIFALLGTILFSYALSLAGMRSLNWTDIMSGAAMLDKNIVKVAFIFVLVGYGTKAGLAPMHTWLPDAHSQAIAPISALLSGVLLKTAVYAILRFSTITTKTMGIYYGGHFFILLGLLSLAIAASFILIQRDFKRLLAYSTIEHIGIIFVGLGVGGEMGLYGALLHVFNHAVTKSLMFFGAGDVVSRYKTHTMSAIRGIIKVMPFTGIMLLIGSFALAGFPPFSLFISEMIIIGAAFLRGSYIVGILVLLFIVIIFSALMYYFSKMLFGEKPADVSVGKEELTSKYAFGFLCILMCVLGVTIPHFLHEILLAARVVLQGGA
jgi:hydrogenase-4 component F